MFNPLPEPMVARMHDLEAIDARDRADGTPHEKRLRQVPVPTGQFIALWAASAPAGRYIEIGTGELVCRRK